MAFKVYNTSNTSHEVPPRSSGPETLNMSLYGHFSISQKAANRLGLRDASRIEFLHDEQYPTDWYIRHTTAKEGFQLRKDGRGAFVFDCSSLKELLLRSVVKNAYLDFRNIIFQLVSSKEGYAIKTSGWEVRKSIRKGGQS